MACLLGMIGGVIAVLGVQWVWAAVAPRRENPPRHRCENHRGWEDTRNFLYYDGTVMPTNKEEHYE